jgi:DNA repair exonuclease SbcCD ATPase subunit
MHRWKTDLHVAKGRVSECEMVLLDLQKEVEDAERNIEIIESGLVDLEQKILQAQNNETHEASASDSDHSSCESADSWRHQYLNALVNSPGLVSGYDLNAVQADLIVFHRN